MSALIVPTVDSVRLTWLLDVLMLQAKHVLCVGDTGTGKTVMLQDKLLNSLDASTYQPIMVTFSARTSAAATQEAIDSKLSRRRKGVFGPTLGQRFVIFVDDLNMPAKEQYGAQPPIELLRQWMDHRGWYDCKDKEKSFMEIVDVQYVAAMGLPGGGRTFISQRYLRHFNVLGFVSFSQESLRHIFENTVTWSVRRHNAAVKAAVPAIVNATVSLYQAVVANFLPTPTKSVYTFNLRDISRVFLGMHQAPPASTPTLDVYHRLWAHECCRVFHDRLMGDADRAKFVTLLVDVVRRDSARARALSLAVFMTLSAPHGNRTQHGVLP